MNRRRFFEDSGRWLSAAALGLLGGYLALKQADSNPSSCSETPFCGRCREFSGCKKPQATEYRSSAGRSGKRDKTGIDGKR